MPWRGHGNPGMIGTDLQTSPNVGGPGGTPAQSYVTGMPVARLPLRPMASSIPGNAAGVPGTPIGYQAGNPSTATWDTRQRTREGLTWGPKGYTDTGAAKLPGDPYADPQGKVAPLMPFQESSDRPGSFANDKLTTHDRHVFWKTGYENSGRGSGLTDPPMDGPPRPILATVNRTISWQIGTTYSAKDQQPINAVNGNADDLSRGYQTSPDGKWIGEQGTGWAPVYGGVPGLYQPYGSYGGYTAGPVKGIQSPVEQGSIGDGPRKIFSGPPHGLHSPTLPDYAQTLGYYQALPSPRAPRQDRPDNATGAGQSYSQTVVPQGQTGTVVGVPAGSSATTNVWNKIRYGGAGAGWRGMAGGR